MRPTTAFDDNVFDFNALFHPGKIFDHPKDVVAHHSLSMSEKRAILASWASDASAIASCPALRAPAGLGARHHRRDPWSLYANSTAARAIRRAARQTACVRRPEPWQRSTGATPWMKSNYRVTF